MNPISLFWLHLHPCPHRERKGFLSQLCWLVSHVCSESRLKFLTSAKKLGSTQTRPTNNNKKTGHKIPSPSVHTSKRETGETKNHHDPTVQPFAKNWNMTAQLRRCCFCSFVHERELGHCMYACTLVVGETPDPSTPGRATGLVPSPFGGKTAR